MDWNQYFVNILGEEWSVEKRTEDPAFDECDGYCNGPGKTIIVQDINPESANEPRGYSIKDQKENLKRVIRHEVIHAFLFEAGLDNNSNEAEEWALNEEMVDWFARQWPKITKVYKELGVL